MLKIKVGLVDDHGIIRTGLRQFFEDYPDLQVVGEASNGGEALNLARDVPMDVLLLDISMPGPTGIDTLAMIRARQPQLAILILSGFGETHYAINLLRQGAQGYLNKQCDPEEIVTAIRALAKGQRYITPAVAELLAQQLVHPSDGPRHTLLSDRETQVFLRLAKGETIGEIAVSLSLSVKTVSTYRTRIMEKMALSSNSDLTYYALKEKLIT